MKFLEVWNIKGENNTFAGIPGSSSEEVNIDVTIKTKNINLEDWMVHDDGISGHSLITYTLLEKRRESHQERKICIRRSDLGNVSEEFRK